MRREAMICPRDAGSLRPSGKNMTMRPNKIATRLHGLLCMNCTALSSYNNREDRRCGLLGCGRPPLYELPRPPLGLLLLFLLLLFLLLLLLLLLLPPPLPLMPPPLLLFVSDPPPQGPRGMPRAMAWHHRLPGHQHLLHLLCLLPALPLLLLVTASL